MRQNGLHVPLGPHQCPKVNEIFGFVKPTKIQKKNTCFSLETFQPAEVPVGRNLRPFRTKFHQDESSCCVWKQLSLAIEYRYSKLKVQVFSLITHLNRLQLRDTFSQTCRCFTRSRSSARRCLSSSLMAKILSSEGSLKGLSSCTKNTQPTSKIKDTTHQTNQVQVKELTHQPLYHLPTRSFIFATMCTTSTTQTAMARRATGDHFMDVSVVFCTISLKTRWVVPFGTHCKTTWY